MTPSKNRLHLDYKDSPDLKAAAGGLAPGERLTIELSVMVSANNDDYLEADVEEISLETEAEEGDETEVAKATPSEDEPVMVEVMREAKRKSKPEVASETKPDAEDDKE